MIIITGASNNHYLTLMNMIHSFKVHNIKDKLIVYNLGLDEPKWVHIQHRFKEDKCIAYKTFDYSNYPEWFNIHINAGQYAWKPTIIYNTACEYPNEIVVWMDSGNVIKKNLLELEQFIQRNGVYSATSSGTIRDWTHPKTIEYMNCTWTDKINRNGACMGFDLTKEFAKKLLHEFYEYSQIKECICPEGSNRNNHRQDQAVFTVLYYKYCINGYIHTSCDDYLCHSIHNDVD